MSEKQAAKYLAVGPHVFGFGDTPEHAIKVARSQGAPRGMRAKAFAVYTVKPDAWVDEYGRVSGIDALVPGYTERRAGK